MLQKMKIIAGNEILMINERILKKVYNLFIFLFTKPLKSAIVLLQNDATVLNRSHNKQEETKL